MRAFLKTLGLSLVLFSATSMAQKAYLEGPDVTGLRDKGVIPLVKKNGNLDSMAIEVGNGYFMCGGASGPWHGGLGLTTLRKGQNSPCDQGPLVVAITTTGKNGSEIYINESMIVKVPKGHVLMKFECKGADLALAKYEDKARFNKIVSAWVNEEGVMTPVKDVKKVSCTNEGWGS